MVSKCKRALFIFALIFHSIFVPIACQEDDSAKNGGQEDYQDDGRIWVALEPEEPPTTTTMKPVMTAEGGICSRQLCQRADGGKMASTDEPMEEEEKEEKEEECLLTQCPLPDAQEDGTAWLVPIKFAPGIDPQQCTRPEQVPLEFEFCFREMAGMEPSFMECMAEGYVVCYESQLDPNRSGSPLDAAFSLANKENVVAKLCNEETAVGKVGERGMAAGLRNWERAGGGMAPKHGFKVAQMDGNMFALQTSFAGATNTYSPVGLMENACLRIRLFNADSPFTRVWYADEHGHEIAADVEMPTNITHKLVNGLALNSDQMRGPWLLGMDMFLRFRPPFNLKIVKRGNRCVPTGKIRSTMIEDGTGSMGKNGNDGGGGGGDGTRWELASATNIGEQFGGRVEIEEDGSVLINYGLGPDWLNLTFAAPSADGFSLTQVMPMQGFNDECWNDECQFNHLYFDYNQLDAPKCRISIGRTRYSSCVQLHPEIDGELSQIADFDGEIQENATVTISDGTQLEHASTDTEKRPEPMKRIEPECAVKNVPIEEFGGQLPDDIVRPYILRIAFLPASLALPTPLCENSLQIRFDSTYQLLVPANPSEGGQ